MTAHEFIEQLFSRPQRDVASNVRYISKGQLELLEQLIGQDEEGAAVQRGMHGGFSWFPSGRWKYVVDQTQDGRRRSLTRLNVGQATSCGSLF